MSPEPESQQRSTPALDIRTLLDIHSQALDYTASLVEDLTDKQVHWRPSEHSSAIGWHLGHQAAVAHFMVRNLTAATPSLDPEIDRLMDSATPEPDRGTLPPVSEISDYRNKSAEHLRLGMRQIDAGDVGSPNQLQAIARTLLVAVINHEFQHSTWIGEVCVEQHKKPMPPTPESPFLTSVDGYLMVAGTT